MEANSEPSTLDEYRILESVWLERSPGFDAAPLAEFNAALAMKLCDRQFISNIQGELPRLQQLRQEVHSLPGGAVRKSHVQPYVDRVCSVIENASDDDWLLDHMDELRLLVWHLELANTPSPKLDPAQPFLLVRLLHKALNDLRSVASAYIHWFEFSLLHDDESWLVADSLSANAGYAYAEVKQLLLINVDRWIHPRLGLLPDQWTTQLNLVLRPLMQQLHPFSDPDVKRIESLSDALFPFTEQLGSLRFDSTLEVLDPYVRENGLPRILPPCLGEPLDDVEIEDVRYITDRDVNDELRSSAQLDQSAVRASRSSDQITDDGSGRGASQNGNGSGSEVPAEPINQQPILELLGWLEQQRGETWRSDWRPLIRIDGKHNPLPGTITDSHVLTNYKRGGNRRAETTIKDLQKARRDLWAAVRTVVQRKRERE